MKTKIDLRPFKFKVYKPDMDLKGEWLFTLKIDGVMAIQTENGWVSRAGKPLMHLPDFHSKHEVVEVYLGDFDSSISAVHTIESDQIAPWSIFTLSPTIDERLVIGSFKDPSNKLIQETLKVVRENDVEGLILIQDNKRIKVKPIETYDVTVIGIQPGTGKYVGKLGAFITDMGKVGTGFTDFQRLRYIDFDFIGVTIEVECMELTKDGKFRHPRFVRIRTDKD